jgi:hypothetical protein
MQINKETESNILNWILDNSQAARHDDDLNKSPRELKFTSDDYQKMQISFEEKFGSDEIKVYFQNKSHKNGKLFNIPKLDDSLVEVLMSFYSYRRVLRKRQQTNIMGYQCISEKDIPYIDPDLIPERINYEC